MRIGLIIIFVTLTGCSTPVLYRDFTSTTVVDYPQIGVEMTQSLGDRLVAKGNRTTGPALRITGPSQFGKKEGEASILTCGFTVQAMTLFRSGTYKSDASTYCYGPIYYLMTHSDGRQTVLGCTGGGSGYICEDSSGKYFLAHGGSRDYLEQDFDKISVINKTVESKPNFVQELLYNGRVKDNLKFVYREFSNDMIRPAFTQEVQYDLSGTTEIGFKSLRLKVLDANNTSIKYKLISNF